MTASLFPIMSRDCPVYHWGQDRWTLARRWTNPQDGLSVYLTKGVATVEAEDQWRPNVTLVPAEDVPPAVLPAGWSTEAVASVLARLPMWQEVCLWSEPPFPPEAIDGDGRQDLSEVDWEWHSRNWSVERWLRGWIDIFPSQMRSRKPEDEILRQWSGAAEMKLMTDQEYEAFAQAVRLEARAEPSYALWEAVARALFLESGDDLCSRLRSFPICAALASRKLRMFFADRHAACARGEELCDRTAKVEQELVPLARASLRARVAQEQPVADAEVAVKLLLMIGDPADVDALGKLTGLDLRQWPVTVSCVGCLAAMTWLERLDLSDARLERGPAGLRPLSALTGLKRLALAGLDLCNSDLGFLRDLVGLEELDLSRNCNLSDGGLSTAGLTRPRHRSLRQLDLRGNGALSDECKQTLRTRLPDCGILV